MTVAVAMSLAAAGCSGHSGTPQTVPSQSSGQGTLGNLPVGPVFASPPTKITPHSPLTDPPADPFAGTPADQWANGAAGIVTPTAGPVGGYTKAQVESAYQTTRKLLIAANLNRTILLGGPPTAFADLLTNDQRKQFVAGLDKLGLNKQGEPVSTREMVTSFAPGGTQLIGDAIKAHGTMRAQAGNVDVDYIFVYPIEPPGQPTRWMRVVVQASGYVAFADWAGAATSFEPWVEYTGSVAGVVCGTTDGYVHPDYPNNSPAGTGPTASPSGTAIDPYAMGNTGTSGCHPTTGT
jgi:hypothetical protein